MLKICFVFAWYFTLAGLIIAAAYRMIMWISGESRIVDTSNDNCPVTCSHCNHCDMGTEEPVLKKSGSNFLVTLLVCVIFLYEWIKKDFE